MSRGENVGAEQVRVSVRQWAACASGLADSAAWQSWALKPWLPVGEDTPALAAMTPMLRRRLNRLGRIALQAAWDCQGSDLGMPIVFASRYGDAARSLALLEDLVSGQEVSPTGFNMSVHNAIGALYAIARGDRSNAVSVAAGRASAAAGLVEAAGLLADGAPEVMLVCYDDTLPEPYEPFRDEPPCAWAWAWRVAPAQAGAPWIGLRTGAQGSAGSGEARPWVRPEAVDAPAGALPAGLDVMRFFLSGERSLVQPVEGLAWHWEAGHA